MTQIIARYRIGEDAALAFDAIDIDVSTVTILAVGMVQVLRNGGVYAIPEGRTPMPLTVTTRAADDTNPGGWTFALAASDTALLTPGVYAVDAKFSLGGSTDITETSALIEFTRAAVA